MVIDDAKNLINTFNNTYDDDDILHSTINANIVVSNAFKVIKVIEIYISELYDVLQKHIKSYYDRLNYYKRNGGSIPSNAIVEDLRDLIDSLKEIKRTIYNNIDDIKNNKTWRYKGSFKDFLDKVTVE